MQSIKFFYFMKNIIEFLKVDFNNLSRQQF